MKTYFEQNRTLILFSTIFFISTCITIFLIRKSFPMQIHAGRTFEQQLSDAQNKEILFRFEEKVMDFGSLETSIEKWQQFIQLSFSPNISGTIRPINEYEFAYVLYQPITNDISIRFNTSVLSNNSLTINHILVTNSPYTLLKPYPDIVHISHQPPKEKAALIIDTSLPVELSLMRKAVHITKNNKNIKFSLLYSTKTNYDPIKIIETNYSSIIVIPNNKHKDAIYTLKIDPSVLNPHTQQKTIVEEFETVKTPKWLGFSSSPHSIKDTVKTFYATQPFWLHNTTSLEQEGDLIISVTPDVSNINYEIQHQSIMINGDFKGNQRYTLCIKPKNIKTQYGTKITDKFKETITFTHAKPMIAQGQDVVIINKKKPVIPLQTLNVTNIKATYQIIRSDYYTAISMLGRNVPVITYTTNFSLTNTPIDTLTWSEFNAQSLTSNRSVLLHINFQNADAPDDSTNFTRIIFTGSSLTALVSSGTLLFQALDLEHQLPIENMRITVWDQVRGSFQDLGKTKTDGTLHIPTPKLPDIVLNDPIVIGILEEGDGDLTFAGHGSTIFNSLENKHLFENGNLIWGDRYHDNTIKSLFFTDRPFYKQGEPIHISLIARNTTYNRLNMSGELFKQNIAINIKGSNGQVLTNFYKKTDSYGVLTASFNLPEQTSPGRYSICAKNSISKFQAYTDFHIREFTPNKGEILITSKKQNYLYQEKIGISINPRLLFGQQITSPIKYKVSLLPKNFDSINFPNHTFGNDSFIERYHNINNNILIDKTHKHNKAVYIDKHITPKFPYNANIMITAETQPENMLPISATSYDTSVYFPVQLGLRMNKKIFYSTEPITINAVAVDPLSDKQLSNTKAQLIITKKTPLPFRMITHWIPKLKSYDKVMLKNNLRLGMSNIVFTPKQDGEYTATLKTYQKGQTTSTTVNFTVDSLNKSIKELIINTDKNEYLAGEKATLEIFNPFPNARLLIAVENGLLREFYVVESSQSIITQNIALTAKDEPNIGITAVLTSIPKDRFASENAKDYGNTIAGSISLPVSPLNKKLTIDIQSVKSNYMPKETVTLNLKAYSSGTQVEGQAIVLIRDKAILDHYQLIDPINTFYSPFPIGLSTWSSGHLIYNFGNIPNSLEQHKAIPLMAIRMVSEEKTAPISIRSNIVYTVFYNARVPLHKNKDSEISFTLPDNVSDFDITVIALTKQNKFGKHQTNFTVSKPLITEPVIPNFVRPGDKVTWGTFLYNLSGNPLDVEVSFENGYSTDKNNKLTLGINETKFLSTETIIDTRESQNWQITGISGELSDGFNKKTPVLFYNPWIASSYTGILDKKTNMTIHTLSSNKHKLTVSVSPSPLQEIDFSNIITNESIYLENVLNKIHAIIGNESTLEQYTPFSVSTLKHIAQKALDSLAIYDNNEFLSTIPGDNTKNTKLQIKALDALIQAHKNNYNVPSTIFIKLQKNILNYSKESSNADSLTKAYAFSILSDLNLLDKELFLTEYPKLSSSLDTQFLILYTMRNLAVPLQIIAKQNSSILGMTTAANISFKNMSPSAANTLISLSKDSLEGRRIINGVPKKPLFYQSYLNYAKKYPIEPFSKASVKINKESYSLKPQNASATMELNQEKNTTVSIKSPDKELFYRIVYEVNTPNPIITNSGYHITKKILDTNNQEVIKLKQGETYTIELNINASVDTQQKVEIIDPLYGGMVPDKSTLSQNGNVYIFTDKKSVRYTVTAHISGEWRAAPVSVRQIESPEVFGLIAQPNIIIE